jgi:hopanoid biosynthesis associated RND transporter like protein HpnN
MMRPVVSIVEFAIRRPWTVVALAILLTGLGLWLTVSRFAINTDTARLISPDIDWRRAELEYDRAFPGQFEVIAAVIDATTPEQADEAAEKLVDGLKQHPKLFQRVTRPDGGPFFDKNGLLFLPREELQKTMEQLGEQQGLLAPMASDPSLRGFQRLIGTVLGGIRMGAVTLEQLTGPFNQFAETFERTLAGQKARLSWRNLLNTGSEQPKLRRIVLAQPVLDFTALQPGAAGVDTVRQTARELGLTPENGVKLRLTGPVPLADEEFATVSENMELNTTLTILAVVLILFMALRSPKIIVAVLATLFAGLIVTSGLGLLLVGRLNLISVAFAVLFIGLGVDFGIQFAVRYRAERHHLRDIRQALREAARGVGFSLTLAAISLAAGFLSFLPTDFKGVSELGLIAGMGMGIAFLASVTLLPALIVVMRPGKEAAPVETRALAAVDRWIEGHRKLVLGLTALVVLAGVPALLNLSFDSNPMNLRSQKVESVATYLDLAHDPDTSPNGIDVLAQSEEAVPDLEKRLRALPEVARTVSLSSFIPEDQPEKLAIIREATTNLEPILKPRQVAPPPTDEQRVEALRTASAALKKVEGAATSPGERAAARLAKALEQLANATPELRSAAEAAITVDFHRLLGGLRTAMTAETITRASLPAELVQSWVGRDGRARISVTPKENTDDKAASERFVSAVHAISPDATGAPVTIARSGQTIVQAFIEAGILALIAITLILWVALRRLLDVLLALGPLVLAGIMTLEAAQLLGVSLNYANIIALPLMFGVGVAFHIYYLLAWRQGVVDVLASSLTRAIFFSALTTGVAFGSLWASSHPGTASMGELLAISLVFTLLAAFIIVPAFLGPPPQAKRTEPSDQAVDRREPAQVA